MKIKAAVIFPLLFPLSVLSEDVPLSPCPTQIITEFVQSKILTKEGLANGSGIKSPSSSTSVALGVLDVASGNLGMAGGNFLSAFVKTGRLADSDYLTIIMKDNPQSITPEAAKEQMRTDVMDAAKIAVGAEAVGTEKEGIRRIKHSFSGGECEKRKCQLLAAGYNHTNVHPKTREDGGFVYTTNFGVSANGRPLLSDGQDRVALFTSELNKRGYVAGFWQARTQTIFSSGSACQITKEALGLVDN